jgi:hypothetical protein
MELPLSLKLGLLAEVPGLVDTEGAVPVAQWARYLSSASESSSAEETKVKEEPELLLLLSLSLACLA